MPLPVKLMHCRFEGSKEVYTIATRQATIDDMLRYIVNYSAIFNNRIHPSVAVDLVGTELIVMDRQTLETVVFNLAAV